MGRSVVDTSSFADATGWTVYIGSIAMTTGVANPGTAADDAALRNTGTYANDQYSSAEISTAPGAGDEVGVTVRDTSGAAKNRYAATTDGVGYNQIFKHVSNNYTALGTGPATTFAVGDLVEMECEGTTLRMYKNGGLIDTESGDTSHTTGRPGINFWNASGEFTNWSGGDVTAAGTARRYLAALGAGGSRAI